MEEKSFVCLTCGQKVSVKALGTKNRNHCPNCLWSVHLDENIPGDRKASCKGLMKPIGLDFKKEKKDKYKKENKVGEIMLIHQCQKCGQISKNRLAGDDNLNEIFKLLENSSTKLTKQTISKQLLGK